MSILLSDVKHGDKTRGMVSILLGSKVKFEVMKLMPHSLPTLFGAVGLLLLTSACQAQTAAPSVAPQPKAAASAATPVAAKSGSVIFSRGPAGLVVTSDDVASDMIRMPEETRRIVAAKPETLQQIASNLMMRRALAHEAEVGNLAQSPSVAAALALARDRILSDARLAQMDAQNAPSDATVQSYARQLYAANSEKFERPAQTRARHILLANTGPESLVKAKAILEQLKGGASFEELAKTNSIDSGSGARGGDLGFFGAGQMVRPFEDAVGKLAKAGDLSEPIESQFGLHIIKLEERREKGRLSFEEARPQLLLEARTAILNDARVQKVQSVSKDISFDNAAIEAFSKSAAP